MAKNTLGQRMRAAAAKAGLKQKQVGFEVAKRIGRSRPYTEAAVGLWYADKSEPEIPALVEFSRLVNADLLWLQTGAGGGQLPKEGRIVPSISLAQAIADPIDYTSSEMVYTYFPCSNKAFVLPITDSRNEPRYNIGYKVVIDPELRSPRPGQMVLAIIGREGVFGQYTERVEKGVKARVIVPLNAAWSEEIMNPKRGDRIQGVMTEFAAPAP
jgi:hypothetical protein